MITYHYCQVIDRSTEKVLQEYLSISEMEDKWDAIRNVRGKVLKDYEHTHSFHDFYIDSVEISIEDYWKFLEKNSREVYESSVVGQLYKRIIS